MQIYNIIMGGELNRSLFKYKESFDDLNKELYNLITIDFLNILDSLNIGTNYKGLKIIKISNNGQYMLIKLRVGDNKLSKRLIIFLNKKDKKLQILWFYNKNKKKPARTNDHKDILQIINSYYPEIINKYFKN